MRRLGRSRWSMAVEARGEARCCRPADCNHRAITASPASPPWSSSAAAAAALPCGIWPLAWRCERRWGADFQDLFARASHQTNKSSKLGPQKKKKVKRKREERKTTRLTRRTWKVGEVNGERSHCGSLQTIAVQIWNRVLRRSDRNEMVFAWLWQKNENSRQEERETLWMQILEIN